MNRILIGVRNMSHARVSKSVFCLGTITSKLPNVKITSSTTLGEIWDAGFVKYKYRMAYPVILWVGFLYYNLWTPYMPEAQKKALKAKEDYLTSVEFHQE